MVKTNPVPERIEGLRKLMKNKKVQAYLIPSTDPHRSEYVPKCWRRREWISGFTGSAGDIIVTQDWAGLWTDSRYFIQAADQLEGSGIELMKLGKPETPSIEKWLKENLKKGDKLGVDPCLMFPGDETRMLKVLKSKGVSIHYIDDNLVDKLWKDQPKIPEDTVSVLAKKFTGETVEEKLGRVREKMAEKGCKVHIVPALDRVAWFLNLRGKDVDYNPVFISYLVITDSDATLYINKKKITKSAEKALKGIKIKNYLDIAKDLKALAKKKPKVWLDPMTTNMWLMGNITGCKVHKYHSPITDFKSIKNATELEGMKQAHIIDGVAMVKFLKWLDENVKKGNVTEMSAAKKLDGIRVKHKDCVGLSFTTISGYAGHGAIVHYDVTKETNVKIEPKGLYLVDSGGQYKFGTTDITRTIVVGKEATKKEKEMFTRVLKGHIALTLLRWPKGFSGKQIEVLARKPLWDVGTNYGHGTGHGIGHYLNVHEGPMGITPRDKGLPLKAGNVLSNEPGYYLADHFGIRHENVLAIVKDEKFSSDDGEWLMFDTLTMCPIDRRGIDPNLLCDEELKWLNAYHKTVYETLAPFLDKNHKAWLKKATAALRKK